MLGITIYIFACQTELTNKKKKKKCILIPMNLVPKPLYTNILCSSLVYSVKCIQCCGSVIIYVQVLSNYNE